MSTLWEQLEARVWFSAILDGSGRRHQLKLDQKIKRVLVDREVVWRPRSISVRFYAIIDVAKTLKSLKKITFRYTCGTTFKIVIDWVPIFRYYR